MLFLKSIIVGFGLTIGLEVALGLSRAIRIVMRSNKKNERS